MQTPEEFVQDETPCKGW